MKFAKEKEDVKLLQTVEDDLSSSDDDEDVEVRNTDDWLELNSNSTSATKSILYMWQTNVY